MSWEHNVMRALLCFLLYYRVDIWRVLTSKPYNENQFIHNIPTFSVISWNYDILFLCFGQINFKLLQKRLGQNLVLYFMIQVKEEFWFFFLLPIGSFLTKGENIMQIYFLIPAFVTFSPYLSLSLPLLNKKKKIISCI